MALNAFCRICGEARRDNNESQRRGVNDTVGDFLSVYFLY